MVTCAPPSPGDRVHEQGQPHRATWTLVLSAGLECEDHPCLQRPDVWLIEMFEDLRRPRSLVFPMRPLVCDPVVSCVSPSFCPSDLDPSLSPSAMRRRHFLADVPSFVTERKHSVSACGCGFTAPGLLSRLLLCVSCRSWPELECP